MKSIAEIRVHPAVAPFMERHGQRALAALTDFVASCSTLDEKLGALGAFAQVLVAFGDSLAAHQLHKTKPASRA